MSPNEPSPSGVEQPLDLPDLQEVEFSFAALGAYLKELRDTEVPVDVTVKGSVSARPERSLELSGVESALRAGEIRGAQLRYLYRGQSWTDTLLRTQQGVRLVRIQSP